MSMNYKNVLASVQKRLKESMEKELENGEKND